MFPVAASRESSFRASMTGGETAQSPGNRFDRASSIKRLSGLVEALIFLLLYDVIVLFGYRRAHDFTRRFPLRQRMTESHAVSHVCWCVDEACIWYLKRSFCLQRSAVATWMLRRRGVHAELVIGCRPIPVESHAWVEVAGTVVNDRPQYQRFFSVLERL